MAKSKAKKDNEDKDAEITRYEAKGLIEAYRDNRHGERRTYNHSVYGEFDMTSLLNFLIKMTDEYGANGVRIYYGAREVEVEVGGKKVMTHAITPVLVTTRRGFTAPPFEELFPNDPKDVAALSPNIAYDFASLCPPDRTHIQTENGSLAYHVYRAKKKDSKKKVVRKK